MHRGPVEFPAGGPTRRARPPHHRRCVSEHPLASHRSRVVHPPAWPRRQSARRLQTRPDGAGRARRAVLDNDARQSGRRGTRRIAALRDGPNPITPREIPLQAIWDLWTHAPRSTFENGWTAVTVDDLAKTAARQYRPLRRYVEREIRPVLLDWGLYEVRAGRVFWIFPTTSYVLTLRRRSGPRRAATVAGGGREPFRRVDHHRPAASPGLCGRGRRGTAADAAAVWRPAASARARRERGWRQRDADAVLDLVRDGLRRPGRGGRAGPVHARPARLRRPGLQRLRQPGRCPERHRFGGRQRGQRLRRRQ